MKPMLARPWGPRFNRYPCYLQPKLNGVRALYQAGVFSSRDEKVWPKAMLIHLHEQLEHMGLPSTVILDGELYRHGWRLQRINRAVSINATVRGPIDDTEQISFCIFDRVHPDFSFSRRWLSIADEIRCINMPSINVVPTEQVYFEEEVDLHFKQWVGRGYEGVMLRPDGPYECDKRSQYLWKKKSWQDAEFLCVGVTHGVGKAAIGIGALILEHEGKTFNVGTGFSDEDRVHLAEHPPINKQVRVRFPYVSEDGIPQCPSFLAAL